MHARAMVISPRRRLSQNFLINQSVAQRIAESIGVEAGGIVVELGAGTGALTQHLINLPASCVVAIELDSRAVSYLRSQLGTVPTLRVVEADVRSIRIDNLELPKDVPIYVVGNIPYHLTGPILFWLYEQADRLRRVVLMVQKEVAARIVAQPGSKTYGILSVATALITSDARILFDVPPSAFCPRPQVISSVVGIECMGLSLADTKRSQVMALVKAAFNQRRKKLRNALSRYFQETGLKCCENATIASLLDRRAEELSPIQFCELAEIIHHRKDI
ncbi:MAG: 16S rRNA (adenine(1518)-N(6)/adenine(1519)-N(6))-dimethyltransferase RsmA [Chlorobi bacterium]|nr:16S rRNA (adenine(1518)-N(6)/adenine(1519)-N(6))-dimethyltransferase RsmA [Chlorobiota bacterium]